MTVERVGSTAFPRHEMRRRVSNYLSYLALAVPRALAIRPDVVLAMTDPPVAGIAGAFVARMSARPFVYNIRDMYPDMAIGGDIVRAATGWSAGRKCTAARLRQAARVIVLGDDMRDRILAKGVAPERVVVVRDGTSISGTVARSRAIPSWRKSAADFRLSCFMPAISDSTERGTRLLQAAEILRNENTGLVFIGDGANRKALQSSRERFAQCSLSSVPAR